MILKLWCERASVDDTKTILDYGPHPRVRVLLKRFCYHAVRRVVPCGLMRPEEGWGIAANQIHGQFVSRK